MTLRVAIQMDPINHIVIRGDSTFALMLEGQRRGHELLEIGPIRIASAAVPRARHGRVGRLQLGQMIDAAQAPEEPSQVARRFLPRNLAGKAEQQSRNHQCEPNSRDHVGLPQLTESPASEITCAMVSLV